jgi:hypothetical protein
VGRRRGGGGGEEEAGGDGVAEEEATAEEECVGSEDVGVGAEAVAEKAVEVVGGVRGWEGRKLGVWGGGAAAAAAVRGEDVMAFGVSCHLGTGPVLQAAGSPHSDLMLSVTIFFLPNFFRVKIQTKFYVCVSPN